MELILLEETMIRDALNVVLNIQDLDMKMLRLLRIRKERVKELEQIAALRKELYIQLSEKEKEISELDKQIQNIEYKIQEISEKIKKLEAQQGSIKKVEEFNSITQEMTALERNKSSLEHSVSDLVDRKVAEEDLLTKIKESLSASESSSLALENEVQNSIKLINEEGRSLKNQRDTLVTAADPEILHIYERLLRNKKDRVIVPIENRTCSGCHISLTAQHENIVRKGKNLVFCEHCSRIHYWQSEETNIEGAPTTTKRRRRRVMTS